MPRAAPGGLVYHVLNRANAGMRIWRDKEDYASFEQAFEEAHQRVPVRVLSYCLMPDHWHLVLWPRRDGELSDFMRWLTVTHTRRWHARRGTAGSGHLYQGRYRSFPIESGEPLLEVCRYVEGNAKRSGEVRRAEDWHWSSLWRRVHGDVPGRGGKRGKTSTTGVDAIERGIPMHALLDEWPVAMPRNWVSRVNAPFSHDVLAALRNSVRRGTPFGSEEWRDKTVKRLHLEFTVRPRGRPRKVVQPEVDAARKVPKPTRGRKAATARPIVQPRRGK